MLSDPKPTSPSKLHIAIIGAGIAGLSAAAFLRRYPQFSITVYERREPGYKDTSAAIGIRASGISIVKQLGISKEDIRAVVGTGYRTYNLREEEMSKSLVSDGTDDDGGLWLLFRQDFKDVLLQKVTCQDGKTEPPRVLYGQHIVRVEPETGIVWFADDTFIEVDLVIGADGIHSKARASVIPPSHPVPTPCGLSVYRFILPMDVFRDAIGKDEKLPAMFNYDEGTFVAIIAAGDEGNRNIVMYPCHDHQQMNLAFAVPDASLKNPAELEYSWNATGSVDEMIKSIQDFPEWLIRVFSRTPEVQLFQARDQEPLPTYVKGRTVLIGDAAHAMVPYQGQGANQALEDVEGLDTILANVLDRSSIPGLLQVWDSVRRPRASQIQRDSRTTQTKIASKEASDAILSVKPHVPMKEALAQLQLQEGSKV